MAGFASKWKVKSDILGNGHRSAYYATSCFSPISFFLGGLLEGCEGGGGVAGLLAAGGRGQGPGGRGGHAAAQVAPPLQCTFGFVTLQGDARAGDQAVELEANICKV